MTSSYEPFDPSLAVPSTPSTLAELRARPVHPDRAEHFAYMKFGILEGKVFPADPGEPAGYRVAAARPDVVMQHFGNAEHRRLAEELGLVRLGTSFESLDSHTTKKELWATRDGAIFASFSDPDRYHLATYFDDGSAHLTWAHANPRTTSIPGSLVSTGGTGNFGDDLAAHAARVREALARGRRFLQVDHIETVVELGRHYGRQLAPPNLLGANLAVMRANKRGRLFVRGAAIVLALAAVLFLLTRR